MRRLTQTILSAIAILAVTALLTACGNGEVRVMVVTATPGMSSETGSPVAGETGAEPTAIPTPESTSVANPQPTTHPPTPGVRPLATPNTDQDDQAERDRAVIRRYVEEEQDAAALTNVMITCSASAGISLEDRIKTGGTAEDQLSELILAGVLDNYDVLECTADEIVKEAGDGN